MLPCRIRAVFIFYLAVFFSILQHI
ncbi:unnamed protein product, partial [Vitis vinifera]|uniref:Uncharacterized protein n=1 Tax=Vitis vinifera TaxID=29760 RepID=D7SHR8_VITVI